MLSQHPHPTTRKAILGSLLLACSLMVSACGGGTSQPVPLPPPAGGGQPGQTGDAVPTHLQGEWHNGWVSPIEYYDPSNGKFYEASGNSSILKLTPEGTYTRSGISVMTVGACTNKLLVNSTGIVRLTATTIQFVDRTVTAKFFDSCTGKTVDGGTLTAIQNTWSLTGEGADAVLTIVDDQNATSRWNRPRGTAGQGYTLSGTLTAPQGHSLYGTLVIACPVATGCANAGDKLKYFKTGSEQYATEWSIPGLQNEEYLVYAWQDLDGNQAWSVGDMMDSKFSNSNGTIINPKSGSAVHLVMEPLTE